MSFPRYPKYKDSGVEWLGEVPEHWDLMPLKAIASYNDDVIDESTPEDSEIEYVDISSVDAVDGITKTETLPFRSAPSRARRKVRHGDTIVSTVRTYLKAIASIAHPPENLIVSTGFAVIRPRKDLSPSFASYFLHSNNFIEEVIARSTGVSYPAINASELVRIIATLPPLPEQHAIAAFLDRETAKIDALIAEQRRLIELLKEKRQAVISHAVTKGLNPDVPIKDSGIEWLGEVPEHWEMKRLKHISKSITVGIVVNPSSYFSDTGVPFIYGGDIREGVIDWEHSRRMTIESSIQNEKTKLRQDDLLTVRVGAPGVTAVVPKECEDGNCASVMLIRRGNFNSHWLCYTMNTRIVRFQVEIVQYGAAQEQFNISHAVNFWIPVPPRGEQDCITERLEELSVTFDALTTQAEQSITLLQERRSALISAAVTGRIDVRGAAGRGDAA